MTTQDIVYCLANHFDAIPSKVWKGLDKDKKKCFEYGRDWLSKTFGQKYSLDSMKAQVSKIVIAAFNGGYENSVNEPTKEDKQKSWNRHFDNDWIPVMPGNKNKVNPNYIKDNGDGTPLCHYQCGKSPKD